MTDPTELLEALCSNATPRKAKSLQVVHSVCEEQRRRGSSDFSVATIGLLSAEQGGPAAGAIRNTTGEAYRALIKSHLDASGGKKVKAKAAKVDPSPFDGISDPVLRARIGILLAENESLRGQLQAARNLANQHSKIDLRSTHFNLPRLSFSQQEISAAEHALSLIRSETKKLKAQPSGRVSDMNGELVFKAGFLGILDKVSSQK